ncbi:glyoxalase [Pseudoclavibacter sp. AY1F1]|uniref:VOC family protein n=1 Tax=Pseudoclavibacter sp. AY1F1 TaxID=2080583 RepID=UPI000CE8CFE9|nr:VOC family protein [Pseudoclavibacter sp. AY1F1]PPF46915.1 glyoxalase [Pseudoclavibacter sp. AY1F1]
MPHASGPGFISLQVRDIEASARFYETYLGFARQPGPPHAVVFDTAPAAFAVRDAAPGVDLESAPLGFGVGIWLHASVAQEVHDAMVADGVVISASPVDGPFGRTFTFVDPDGYQITLHDRA